MSTKILLTLALGIAAISAQASTTASISSGTTCQGTVISLIIIEDPSDLVSGFDWERDGDISLGFADVNLSDNDLIAGLPGVYHAVVHTASGDFTTNEITINPKPDVNTTIDKTKFCEGDHAVLTLLNYNPAFQYDLYESDTSLGRPSASSFNLTTDGAYSIVATNPVTGCTKTSKTRTIVTKPRPLAEIFGFPCTEDYLYSTDYYRGLKYSWMIDGVPQSTTKSFIKVTTAGIYTLTTTYGGCSSTSAPDTTYLSPAGSITGPTEVCTHELPVTLSATPGFANYLWIDSYYGPVSAGVDTLDIYWGGRYRVVFFEEHGCIGITPYYKVKINFSANSYITPLGSTDISGTGSVNLRANNGSGITYSWYKDGDEIPGATARTINVTEDGSYTVLVTKGTCENMSDPIIVTGEAPSGKFANLTAAPDEISNDIAVYPNPSNGVYHIDAVSDVNATVRDMQGRIILQLKGTKAFDISNYPAGIYLLQLTDMNGKTLLTKRIIKQ